MNKKDYIEIIEEELDENVEQELQLDLLTEARHDVRLSDELDYFNLD